MALPMRSESPRELDRELDSPVRRPQLTLIRTGNAIAARRVLALAGLLCFAFMGIVAFEANIASGQMELDKLNKTVSMARDHYEELRQERAMLHAPDVLRAAAAKSMMQLAPTIKFLNVDKTIVAVVDESISAMDSRFADPPTSRLDEFGHIKLDVKSEG
jgi:hypothetical protein